MWRSGSIQEATTEGIDIPRNPAKYQNKETEESSSEQYPHKVSKSKGARRVQQVEQNREEEHQAEKQTYIRNLADAIDQQLRDEQVGFMEKTIMREPDCHPTYYHWAVLRVELTTVCQLCRLWGSIWQPAQRNYLEAIETSWSPHQAGEHH